MAIFSENGRAERIKNLWEKATNEPAGARFTGELSVEPGPEKQRKRKQRFLKNKKRREQKIHAAFYFRTYFWKNLTRQIP